MLLAIGFTIAAEDVRHFQLWAIHGTQRLEERWRSGLDLQGNRVRQQIERARRRAKVPVSTTKCPLLVSARGSFGAPDSAVSNQDSYRFNAAATIGFAHSGTRVASQPVKILPRST
jgi:hypothetical protein